ncbi:hypothetical protein T35B1_17811 [Salinisphaera shabanensis T35B1]|uniref:Kiwa anti-phage protein KwaB-like domain-containing protein n=1 Tax=Salinisphaera shabanensis TaxID=180542 RepID=UPI0002123CBF
MTEFSDWRQFDYDNSTVQLWVFKKSTTPARFRAWHVRTDDEVEQLFRETIKSETARISEPVAYSHIAQNNESSCLLHSLQESEGLIALLQAVDVPENENAAAGLKQLKGAIGYLVKFQGEEETVYAIRKTAPTWKPTVRKKMMNVIFVNGELSAVPEETFSFDSYFDFYCFRESVFISAKRAYESTVSDKAVYKKSFDDLVVDPEFSAIFSNLDVLKNYVGQNAMHLRRMTVIQQKAVYNRPNFAQRLKEVSELRGWEINFDPDGKIDVSPETARTILQVLLDHRLLSEVTETTYDVPDAEAI